MIEQFTRYFTKLEQLSSEELLHSAEKLVVVRIRASPSSSRISPRCRAGRPRSSLATGACSTTAAARGRTSFGEGKSRARRWRAWRGEDEALRRDPCFRAPRRLSRDRRSLLRDGRSAALSAVDREPGTSLSRPSVRSTSRSVGGRGLRSREAHPRAKAHGRTLMATSRPSLVSFAR